jgi:hypothetical protein
VGDVGVEAVAAADRGDGPVDRRSVGPVGVAVGDPMRAEECIGRGGKGDAVAAQRDDSRPAVALTGRRPALKRCTG